MKRTSEETVNVIRDVVLRRRAGLPAPQGIDVDELLEDSIECIQALERRISYLQNSADRY